MLVALGENGIKTVEDLAGCATDDLHGWVEQTSGTTTRHAGVLDGFGLSRDECGAIIMKARARVGWIAPRRVPSANLCRPPRPRSRLPQGEKLVQELRVANLPASNLPIPCPHFTRFQQDRISFGNLGTVGFRDLTTS